MFRKTEHPGAVGRWALRGSNIAQLLKGRRKALRLTQASLADELGIKASHISLLESGQRKPSLNLVAHLADALGLDREEILLGAHPHARALLSPKESNQRPQPSLSWQPFCLTLMPSSVMNCYFQIMPSCRLQLKLRPKSPIFRLAASILWDALRCLQHPGHCAKPRSCKSRRERCTAWDWFYSSQTSYPYFSFMDICSLLDFSPQLIRANLRKSYGHFPRRSWVNTLKTAPRGHRV